MSRWRFATWNLDWWRKNERRSSPWELISRTGADVMALQEVRGAEIREIRANHGGESAFSQEIFERANLRWMGCGLLLREGARLLESGVIDQLPKPQRGLWARIDLPDVGELAAVSWHSPNKAGEGLAVKMAAFRAMCDWLEAAPRPLVLGADLNTWMDPVELAKPEPDDPHFEEHAFVSRDPRHGLEDGFRQALEQSGRLETLAREQPQGPLAVSHVLASGSHRMDRIFISPGLSAIDGDYLLDAARKAGSDHALHWLDLQGPNG